MTADRSPRDTGEITLFENDEFRLEFVPTADGGLRVDAPEVARQLGFRDARDLLRTIPEVEKGSEIVRTPNGGHQPRQYLTEAGFFRSMGQRQPPRIKNLDVRAYVQRFQDWVYREVLPQIRRTGAYIPAQREGGHSAEVSVPRSQLDVLRAALDEIAAAQEQAARAEQVAISAETQAVTTAARLDAIEGRHDWYAALGYARIKGLPTDRVWLQRLGRRAGQIGREADLPESKVQHGLYGRVNQWPGWCWDQAYDDMGDH